MQWQQVTSSNLPKPSETVLGLWPDEFWDQVKYSPESGWYSAVSGAAVQTPIGWARVDARIPKSSDVGEVGPVGEEGPLGPDAPILAYVREFLEQLIEVRDVCTAAFTTKLPAICGKYECYDDWAADKAAELLKIINLLPAPAISPIQGEDGPPNRMVEVTQFKRGDVTRFSLVERLKEATEKATQGVAAPPLALDVSLEQARALHRVWRALNDGDCPKCHKFHAATEIHRAFDAITCPSCRFHVKKAEIEAIEKMFAPAMNAAVAIFEQWRTDTRCDSCGRMRITKKTLAEHWPADFKPEGPDHVPAGFCNGICGAKGIIGSLGFIGL